MGSEKKKDMAQRNEKCSIRERQSLKWRTNWNNTRARTVVGTFLTSHQTQKQQKHDASEKNGRDQMYVSRQILTRHMKW
jgi:hypothetical protein